MMGVEEADVVAVDPVVMRRQRLRDHVDLVEPEMLGGHVERNDRFTDGEALQRRDADLDDETPARREVGGCVLETTDLFVLAEQIRDRAVDEVHEGEAAFDPGGRHVADHHRHPIGVRLRLHSVHHRLRQLDAVHLDAAGTQRERHPPGPDRELERSTVAGERRQKVDRRTHDPGFVHLPARGVVLRGDAFVEQSVGHRLTLPSHETDGHRVQAGPGAGRIPATGVTPTMPTGVKCRPLERLRSSGRLPTDDGTEPAGTVMAMDRGRRLAYAALIVVIGIAADQASKEWALNALENGRIIDVLPTLEFDLAYNSGFSFSTGSGRGNLVGLLVIGLCIFIMWQIWREARPVRSALYAVILGGAIGNLIDRVFRADDGLLSGKVIDFIDVRWYAVFNVADMLVVCGCIAFVLHEVWTHRKEQANTPVEAAESTSADVSG